MHASIRLKPPLQTIGAVVALVLLIPASAQASADVPDFAGLPSPVIPAPADTVQNTEEWRTRLVTLFDRGALSNEQQRRRPVTKWLRPIDLAVRGDAGPTWLADIEAIAADIAGLTGQTIEVQDNPLGAGDIDIYVTDRPGYWPFFVEPASPGSREPFTCIALPLAVDGRMQTSRIHINAGVLSPATVKACLLEEIFQSMGFFGEIDEVAGTLLNDDVGYQGLGPIDRLLLSTLYDPRLRAGMDRDEALPLARVILGEHLAGGR
jgi:hypothetical protein